MGDLAHLRIKRKKVRAYKNVEKQEHCVVELYRKYLSLISQDLVDNSFYLRALPNPKGNMWYYSLQ